MVGEAFETFKQNQAQRNGRKCDTVRLSEFTEYWNAERNRLAKRVQDAAESSMKTQLAFIDHFVYNTVCSTPSMRTPTLRTRGR